MVNDSENIESSKYAILNLSSGVELIFKEKLKNEHWSLLFEDINKANKSLLKTGDFKSVNSLTARKRLTEICEVNLKKLDPKDHLNTLRLKRNKIEHFSVTENIESLKGLIANVLFAIIKFVESEFDSEKISENQNLLFQKIKEQSIKFEKYAALKLVDIKPDLEKWTHIFDCPQCLNQTLAIVDDGLICFFCEEAPNSEILAEEWEGTSPLECPDCNYHSIIEYEYGQLCLECGDEPRNLAKCVDCEKTFEQPTGEEYLCDDCNASRMYEESLQDNWR